ncbi:MAG: CBS domain-containing protein [Thermoplasmata archaeon]
MVLRAKDIMHTDLLVMPMSSSVSEGARQMAASRKGYVLVSEKGPPIAIVTEWDLIAKVLAIGRDPAQTTLGEIATSPLVTAGAETATEEIVALMDAKRIRRMLLTRNGVVIGMVTSNDVLAAFKSYVNKISADIARMQPSAF